jgi:hypothetical protein
MHMQRKAKRPKPKPGRFGVMKRVSNVSVRKKAIFRVASTNILAALRAIRGV